MPLYRYFYKPILQKKGSVYNPTEETIYGFCHLHATDNYLYATVHGKKNPTSMPTAIWKFDWEGNPITEYQCDNTPIESFTVDEETGLTGACEYNCCQIFRKDIILSGTALAINVFGSADNQLNRQTAFALGELARDLNRVALFGRRVEATATTRGEAGGLYFFGTRSNSPAIDALTTKLDSTLVNDAAQAVMGAGGDPTQILCSPGQARVLSCEYKNQLQILRSDDRRGAYVAVVVNEINGRGMTIMADPDVPDTDVWVLDPAGFGLSSLNGRAITDTDATPKGFDGIKRMALGELTFVFRNAAQRICRISNLQSSSEALAAIKAGN